jgi:hypothetical protein
MILLVLPSSGDRGLRGKPEVSLLEDKAVAVGRRPLYRGGSRLQK